MQMVVPHSSRNYTMGMFSKLLRRFGFCKEKHRMMFSRHTVGIGGLYARPVDGGCELRIREYDVTMTFSKASEMEKELERLEDLDFDGKIKWMNRVKEYGDDSDGCLQGTFRGVD